MPLQLPPSTTRYDTIALAGGLDLLTPTSRLKPGYVRDAVNFEASITGGYSRARGYERYDGRASPSAAHYATLTVAAANSALVPGATITGATSAARARIIDVEDATLVAYTRAAGSFVVGEAITVAGVAVGSVTGIDATGAGQAYPARMQALAADSYRADIGAVPGSGPIRGVASLRGIRYAWRNNAGGTALLLYKATSGGWVNVALGVVLAPGGRVQTDLGNFDGHAKLYGCDGVNPGFQFDGLVYTPVPTGNMPDAPNAVLVHKDHLWFAFGTNVQSSGIATPFDWTASAGSFSFRVNDTVTTLLRQAGDQSSGAMSVTTMTATYMVYGNSAADFRLAPFEESSGARAYGAQRIGGQSLLFGDTGVFSIGATQAFGNFAPASLTLNIRPWTQARREQCTASLVNREKSQYRVFFADGFALYVTISNGKLVGAMPQFLLIRVTCACQGDSPDGRESSFVGAADGRVYQLDAGTSHDGEPLAGYFTLTFAAQGNSEVTKRYRGATIEIQGTGFAEFIVSHELSYGDLDRPQSVIPAAGMLELASGQWDRVGATWDVMVWDGRTLAPSSVRLDGSGENLALRLDCTSALFETFTVNSVILKYSVRKAAKA